MRRKTNAEKIRESLHAGARKNRPEEINKLISELRSQKKQIDTLEDLVNYHRDRISVLESNNHAILLELKAKEIELLEIKDLQTKVAAPKKKRKKSSTSKKSSNNKDLGVATKRVKKKTS